MGDQQSGGNSVSDPYADHPILSTLPVSVRQQVSEYVALNKPINAIKVTRDAMPGLGLKEAKELIEELRQSGDRPQPRSQSGIQPRSTQLVSGIIDKGGTTLTIYRDGTFTVKGLFFTSEPDRLLGFSSETDSMRRKSTSGRGAAFIATGGISLLASNNRGVLYVTVTGQRSGAKTYTSKNPENRLLTIVRSLQAAADQLLASPPTTAAPSRQPSGTDTPKGSDIGTQLKTLADLHASGALSDSEFAAAKARLLS